MIELCSQLDSLFAGKQPGETCMVLIVVYDKTRILLGLKKRGVGAGLWSSVGGRIEHNESIITAAKRELLEESGLTWRRGDYRGVIKVNYVDWQQSLLIYVFGVSEFSGTPKETEEMTCQWFDKVHIPYDTMWPDDEHWMPLFFEGKCFEVRVSYTREQIGTPRVTVREQQVEDLPGIDAKDTLP